MTDYRKKSKDNVLPKNDSEGNNIDLNALAELIASKVSQGIEIPQKNGIIYKDNSQRKESFDDFASMDALAKTMVVQRGDKSSNFEDLGGVNKTKKGDQTNTTIDLLSDLED